jgi:4,5-DOPA dioxygenase extradiol
MRMPVLFVSHGSPTLIVDDVPARKFLSELGGQLPRPRAILCVSAHWDTPELLLGSSPKPPMIYDFFGFADELYEQRYPAPGSEPVAQRAQELLQAAGIDAELDSTRGLDHGAWVPLKLMYPAADIPVVQLSVQSQLPPAHSLAAGRAVAALRDEGVLIVASGAATHNLGGFRGQSVDSPVESYAVAFEKWLDDAVQAGNERALVNYLAEGPLADRNHPTSDHYLPLLVAQGAAGTNAPGAVMHRSFVYGILAMTAFRWE